MKPEQKSKEKEGKMCDRRWCSIDVDDGRWGYAERWTIHCHIRVRRKDENHRNITRTKSTSGFGLRLGFIPYPKLIDSSSHCPQNTHTRSTRRIVLHSILRRPKAEQLRSHPILDPAMAQNIQHRGPKRPRQPQRIPPHIHSQYVTANRTINPVTDRERRVPRTGNHKFRSNPKGNPIVPKKRSQVVETAHEVHRPG